MPFRAALGTVVFNSVDAAIATLQPGQPSLQAFLPSCALPQGTAEARVGDDVIKVGRTSGLTNGKVSAVGTVVGPIPYVPGNFWFDQQIEIQGVSGTMFSDHGG